MKHSKVYKIWGNCLLIIISSSIAFIFAEFLYREYLQTNSKNQYSVSPTSNQYKFYQFDELLGWSNKPLMKGIYKRDEFEYEIYINSDGMRQQEISKKKLDNNIARIAVLGDSFVWGIGVSDEQRFTDILEKKLTNATVLNFGVSGYAPIQYYLLIDKILEIFNPDIFVIALCSNDFADNVHYNRYGYSKPYFKLDDNEVDIVIDGYPIQNHKKFGKNTNDKQEYVQTYDTFFKSKILAGLLNLFVKPLKQKDYPPQAGLKNFHQNDLYNYGKLNNEQKEYAHKSIYINQQIIKKIKNKLDKKSKRLVVISSASKCDYDADCKNNGENPNYEVYKLIENSMKEINVNYINTIDIIDSKKDFWEKDGHWNLNGHIKIANTLYKFLDNNGWVEY